MEASGPGCGARGRWRGPAAVAGPGQASSRRAELHISDQAPPVWRAPEGPEGSGVPVGGGGARPRYRWAVAGPDRGARGWRRGQAVVPVGGGARPRCPWEAAGPGRASRRRAERSSLRGRLAGGPPPTGTYSGRARRRPEHQRRHSNAPPQQRPGIQKTDIRIGCRPVVELGGFEPPTFSLRTRRATNCAIAPRTRTA